MNNYVGTCFCSVAMVYNWEEKKYETAIDHKGKHDHPYTYDPFILWHSSKVQPEEINGTIYSDRLLRWDWDKHNKLCRKHFGNEGQYWNNREPEKIEAFLRDWVEDQALELVFIEESCNRSSGYPVWAFCYKKVKSEVINLPASKVDEEDLIGLPKDTDVK